MIEGVEHDALSANTAWSKLTNVASGPAVVVRAGLDAVTGLPVGLQVLGRQHADTGVLAAVRDWERAGVIRPPGDALAARLIDLEAGKRDHRGLSAHLKP